MAFGAPEDWEIPLLEGSVGFGTKFVGDRFLIFRGRGEMVIFLAVVVWVGCMSISLEECWGEQATVLPCWNVPCRL